jgi:hypothetical protein
MSTQEYIRSVTDIIPDDIPKLTPLPESSSSNGSFSWQTWLIIILILALLGINVFAYLAKGTEETASLFQKIFGPILAYFGYTTLETTKQTVENTSVGTKAGVDIVTDATISAIDTIEDNTIPPQGKMAKSSLPVQEKIQHAGADIDKWQQDSLAKALDNAKQEHDVKPDDSRSSIQTTGKSGWCYIGEEQGVRICSQVGVNDVCMSQDVFPNQAICMNPNLRV